MVLWLCFLKSSYLLKVKQVMGEGIDEIRLTHELIIVEAGSWVHGGSIYQSCLKTTAALNV